MFSGDRYTAFAARRMEDTNTGPGHTYSLVIRAVVESALVTWVGLVLYEGASYSEDVLPLPLAVSRTKE
jgi:hypothetical protein